MEGILRDFELFSLKKKTIKMYAAQDLNNYCTDWALHFR